MQQIKLNSQCRDPNSNKSTDESSEYPKRTSPYARPLATLNSFPRTILQ